MIDETQIIIIDDCSIDNCDEIIADFSKLMDIKYYKNETNIGVGATRQRGIELADTPYLMFMDADDSLYNEYALLILYKAITAKNLDIVSGGFIQEMESSDNIKLPLSQKALQENQTWIWARLYLRSFLVDNKITFGGLRYNEDFVFMAQCLALNPKKDFVKNTVYVWHYNETSVTRQKDGAFCNEWNRINKFITGLCEMHKQKKKMGLIDNEISLSQTTDGLCVLYWYFIQMQEGNNENVKLLIPRMQEYYNLISVDYKDLLHSTTLTDSYFNSSYTFGDIANKTIPKATIYEVIQDLEANKNEVKYDSNCKYQFG